MIDVDNNDLDFYLVVKVLKILRLLIENENGSSK
jgi:hypothetical protein